MKTSLKIVFTTAGVMIALLVAALMVLHEDLKTYLATKELIINYQPVSVPEFQNIDITGLWKIKVRQGREQKLEIGQANSIDWSVESNDGVLFIRRDTTIDKVSIDTCFARITVSKLLSIQMRSGGEIYLDDLSQDTLSVKFNNGGSLKGYGNKIKYMELDTYGEVLVQLKDDPDD